MRRAPLALALLSLAAMPLGARGDGTTGPAAITCRGTSAEEALAERGAAAFALGAAAADARAQREGARLLVLAGPAGVRRASELLARGAARDAARLWLLQVLAGSPRAEVEAFLLAAARTEDRFEPRALAADALAGVRTPAALAEIVRLAADPVPAVRASALRSLFAMDTEAARQARAGLPRDPDERIHGMRLTLHRLRADGAPALRPLASHTFFSWAPASTRLAAARLLASLGPAVDDRVLRWVVLELSGPPQVALPMRVALGAPLVGYDLGEQRRAAAEALLAALRDSASSGPARRALLAYAVRAVARPLHVGDRVVDVEAHALLMATLPEMGAEVVPPVVKGLAANAFEQPLDGCRLLRTMDPDLALPALRSLVRPDDVAPEVLDAVVAAFREIGRIGDVAVARTLLDRARPTGVRVDAVLALRDEPWDVAGPLLSEALDDAADAVASQAAQALEDRPEPEARRRLADELFDGTWRAFERQTLTHVASPVDELAWTVLERAVRQGSDELRAAVIDEMAGQSSPVRGPRALGLLRTLWEDRVRPVEPSRLPRALVTVDGLEAVRFIRQHLPQVRRPGLMLRNLRIVAETAALDLVLEVAARTPDEDLGLLGEIARVLSGKCGSDVTRTDPFWRRLLAHRDPDMRRLAVTALSTVAHGPLASVLLPFLTDEQEPAKTRTEALLAMAGEPGQPPEDLLWRILESRAEDENLRIACGEVLAPRAAAATRASALTWILTPLDATDAAPWVARVAGTGAGPELAQTLLARLDTALATRYATRPYRPEVRPDESVHAPRPDLWIAAIAASRDPAALDGLARRLFDVRFADWCEDALHETKLEEGGTGGCYAPVAEPPDPEVSLHQAATSPRTTPSAPIPPEADRIVRAILVADGAGVQARVARAVAAARDDGRLAAFPDLYLHWLARGMANVPARLVGEGERLAGAARVEAETRALAAGRVFAGALDATAPADGIEEWRRAADRSYTAEGAGAWGTAATEAERALVLGARLGLIDLPPRVWIDRNLPPPPSWLEGRARADLLRAAEAGAAGRLEEARAGFARGLARAPLSPSVFRSAAYLRIRCNVDSEHAADDVDRAIDLEARRGDPPSPESRRALAFVKARAKAR